MADSNEGSQNSVQSKHPGQGREVTKWGAHREEVGDRGSRMEERQVEDDVADDEVLSEACPEVVLC
jgi:hypothetical protein